MANLLDRLPDPGRFLGEIHVRLRPGGVLALASPYAWLEEFTPRDRWLGGRFERGRPLRARDQIARRLEKRFAPVCAAQDVEFVIRESARYYQHGIAELTLWRRVR